VTATWRLVIAALVAIPPLLVLATAALYPTDQLFPNQGDLNLYLTKAQDFASGRVPYRDFPFEYPPAALIPMVVPYLAGQAFGTVDLDAYKWLFAGWEAGLLLVLGLVLLRIDRLRDAGARRAGTRRADAAVGYSGPLRTGSRLVVVTAGALLAITFRFDLFPALFMAIALWAALSGRAGVAGVALGLGVLAKLFPIAILPALAIPWLVPFDLRGLSRLGASLGGTLALGLAPFVAVAGSESTLQFLRYNAERGLQVESIGGGLALLVGLLTGRPVEMNFRFSSVNVEGGLADAWLALLPVMTIAGFGLVAWLGWRRIREEVASDRIGGGTVRPGTVVELATVCLLLLLATSKIYSIQYVVWLVPVAALLTGKRFWLAAALVALTIPIHPLLYEDLVNQEALAILVLNARNALLIGLLAWMVLGVARYRPRTMAVEPKATARTDRERT
jgi:hypothetical protein